MYENTKSEQLYIAIENNQLHSQRQGSEKLKLKGIAKDQLFFQARINSLEFSRDAIGAVVKGTLKEREPDMVWTKTNKPMPFLTFGTCGLGGRINPTQTTVS